MGSPSLQFIQLEDDLVHIFENREVFIFLLACATRNSLQCPLQFRGVFRKTISDEQIWTKQNTYCGTHGIQNRGLNIWTDAVFQMWKILSAGFAVMYIFPKNLNGNSASKKRSF